MVLNLIDIVVGRDALEELNEEYIQWRPEEPKVLLPGAAMVVNRRHRADRCSHDSYAALWVRPNWFSDTCSTILTLSSA